ncbi:MAG: ABC transporter permease [Candidatus Acidiferrales bacterium]
MTSLLQHIRYGVRMLARNSGFTLIAILTLALGIGMNTVMFSFVNAWVIHPLPYPHPDQLVVIQSENTKTGSAGNTNDAADIYDIQRSARSFDQLSVSSPTEFNLTGGGTPDRILGARVSWNFFETLGATPALGRSFLPEEDRPGAAHVAILSRGLWETRYAGDPQIIGRTIQIDGESYSVVGVMPAKFQLPLTGESNIWTPLALTEPQRADRLHNWLFTIARMKPGVTLAQAQADTSGIEAQLAKTYPETNADQGAILHTLQYQIGREQGNDEVVALFGIVGLVLLIACANVANLTLTRATGRTRELAVRAAVGASRPRLIRQLLTETVLVFFAGSVAGLGVAHFGLGWIEAGIPAHIRGFLVNYGEVSLDLVTLLYSFAIAFATGLLFGLAPAISASKLDVNSMLKEASGRATGHRQGARLRSALVVGEVALAVVTVICSMLLVQSFLGQTRANPGFHPENVISAQLELPATKYQQPADIRNFYDRVMQRIQSSPDLQAAGATSSVPFADCCSDVFVFRADQPAPAPGEFISADYAAVTPGYFRAMEIALIKGRSFELSDGPAAAQVVVINQTLANYYWPHQDPIGQKLRFTHEQDITATVVGVVQDVKLYNAPKQKRDRELYVPFAQFPSRAMGIVVRSSADPVALSSAIRSDIWSVDADQPVSQVRSIVSLMDEQYSGYNLTAKLMGFFVAMALFLGAIGIYGVVAFNVAQRTHEIGIRMALGAPRGAILRLVFANGLWLAGLGIAIGLGIALAASRLLATLLYSVSATDVWTYAGCTLLLGAAALAACYLPARRAMRVDPMEALRYE